MHRVLNARGMNLLLLAAGLAVAAGCASPQPYEETAKRHFLSLNRPSEKNSKDQFRHAQDLYSSNSRKAAYKAFKALVDTWPGAAEAAAAQHEFARLAEERGKSEAAFNAYQDLLTKFPGTMEYEEALEAQFRIASKVLERRKHRLLIFGGFGAYEKAADMFAKVARNGPRWAKAPEAQFLSGTCHELNDEFELAIAAYLICEQRYPDSPFAEPAAFGRLRGWKRLVGETPNDQDALEQAWASAQSYLKAHEDSPNRAAAEALRAEFLERRADMAYERGRFYDRRHKPAAALVNYREFLSLFPDAKRSPEVRARVEALEPVAKQTEAAP